MIKNEAGTDTSDSLESSEYASELRVSNSQRSGSGSVNRPVIIDGGDDDVDYVPVLDHGTKISPVSKLPVTSKSDADDIPIIDLGTKISPVSKQPVSFKSDDKFSSTVPVPVPGPNVPARTYGSSTAKAAVTALANDGPGKRKIEDASGPSQVQLGPVPAKRGYTKRAKASVEETPPKQPTAYVQNKQRIAFLSTNLQTAEAKNAAMQAELEATKAELARMRNATVTSQDGFILKRELQTLISSAAAKDRHIKHLRNAVSFPKWLQLSAKDCKSVLQFLTIDEVHFIDLAMLCNAGAKAHWKDALDSLLIPAFDKHVYTSIQSLEWVVSRKLVLKNCRVELTNAAGCTALGLLMTEGKFELAKALLSMGVVRLDEVCEQGVWSPIHSAAHNDDHRALTFLVNDLNCSTEMRDHRGWTALHWAVLRGSARCVEVLLAAGSKLEALTDEPARTAVHLACQVSSEDILMQLINAGARLDCLDQENTSAMLICVNNKSLECARILLQHGAPANVPNTSNWTPLKLALHKDEAPFLDLFFSQGVDYRMPVKM